MVNREIVTAKISHIQKALRRLKSKSKVSLKEFRTDTDIQDIIIYNLQTAIQGCIDIGSHIISDEGWTIPGHLAGISDILLEHKVISKGIADKMRLMIGFRNIIVHEYEEIDIARVYHILKNRLIDIQRFLIEICRFAKV